MQMRQIHYFLALCEEHNFTKAANRCGVSQPSLTNGIKRLEIELGGKLFLRGRSKTILLPLGVAVRPYFQQIARSAERAKYKIKTYSESVASRRRRLKKTPRKRA